LFQVGASSTGCSGMKSVQ